jgi:hypothetical protein
LKKRKSWNSPKVKSTNWSKFETNVSLMGNVNFPWRCRVRISHATTLLLKSHFIASLLLLLLLLLLRLLFWNWNRRS